MRPPECHKLCRENFPSCLINCIRKKGKPHVLARPFVCSQFLVAIFYIIPPCAAAAAAAASAGSGSFGISLTVASVIRISEATEAAL